MQNFLFCFLFTVIPLTSNAHTIYCDHIHNYNGTITYKCDDEVKFSATKADKSRLLYCSYSIGGHYAQIAIGSKPGTSCIKKSDYNVTPITKVQQINSGELQLNTEVGAFSLLKKSSHFGLKAPQDPMTYNCYEDEIVEKELAGFCKQEPYAYLSCEQQCTDDWGRDACLKACRGE